MIGYLVRFLIRVRAIEMQSLSMRLLFSIIAEPSDLKALCRVRSSFRANIHPLSLLPPTEIRYPSSVLFLAAGQYTL